MRENPPRVGGALMVVSSADVRKCRQVGSLFFPHEDENRNSCEPSLRYWTTVILTLSLRRSILDERLNFFSSPVELTVIGFNFG